MSYERRKELALRHIAGMTNQAEFRAYWQALGEEQPDMQRDPDVIRAKDERKAAMYRERIMEAERESWRRK